MNCVFHLATLLAQSDAADGGASRSTSALQIIQSGGVVGYILLALSVAALAMIIVHVIQIRRSALLPLQQLEQLDHLIKIESDLPNTRCLAGELRDPDDSIGRDDSAAGAAGDDGQPFEQQPPLLRIVSGEGAWEHRHLPLLLAPDVPDRCADGQGPPTDGACPRQREVAGRICEHDREIVEQADIPAR